MWSSSATGSATSGASGAGTRSAWSLPVGRDQAERVPAPLAPLVADPVALEDHMLDAEPGEVVAHGQARLPGADHRDRIVAPVGRRQGVEPPGDPGSLHELKCS